MAVERLNYFLGFYSLQALVEARAIVEASLDSLSHQFASCRRTESWPAAPLLTRHCSSSSFCAC